MGTSYCHLSDHGNLNSQKLPSAGGIRWPWCSVRLLSLELLDVQSGLHISLHLWEALISVSIRKIRQIHLLHKVFCVWYRELATSHRMTGPCPWSGQGYFFLIWTHRHFHLTYTGENEWMEGYQKKGFDFGIFAIDIQGLAVKGTLRMKVILHPHSNCTCRDLPFKFKCIFWWWYLFQSELMTFLSW